MADSNFTASDANDAPCNVFDLAERYTVGRVEIADDINQPSNIDERASDN